MFVLEIIIAAVEAVMAGITFAMNDNKKYIDLKDKERNKEHQTELFSLEKRGFDAKIREISEAEKQRYLLAGKTNKIKIKYALKEILYNPSFGKNCAIEYDDTGKVSDLCALGGFDANKLENARQINEYEETEAYKRQVKTILLVGAVCMIIILSVLYKKEFVKLIKS